ncbi:MAG TPA: serine protease [Solirubrobacteraceae bacterium]
MIGDRLRLATLAGALALTCLAAPAAAADRAPTARASVVGGGSVPQGAYPWIVAMSRGCGGSLIAPDRVLTAGHCVEDLRVETLRLYVGARTRKRGSLRYDGIPVQGVDVATHPGYKSLSGGGPANDVALVRLARPVEGVAPVRLAVPEEVGLYGAASPVTVLGWGVTRSDPRASMARGLRSGRLSALSDRSCGRVYGGDGGYRPSVMLCARSRNQFRKPNTSPCVGDSGGPLITDGGIQVGVVSFGISCGALREPTVFAEVAGLRPFIDAPEPVWSPQPLARPTVSGRIVPGEIVSCDPPPFRNQVRRLRYRWGVNRLLVATGRRVRITSRAAGKILQCRVVAENEGGETPSAASPPLRVPRS